jgi:4'-phosphopantetheinyl transferase
VNSGGGWPLARAGEVVLGPGAIHLWSANLDSLLGGAGAARACLAPGELERAAAFRFERDAGRFVVGRALLRRLLGGYLGVHPAEPVLATGEHGKPLLDPPGSIHFNLSHSGGVALMAFSREAEVGVDVERIQDFPDLEAMMRRYFAPAERDAIAAMTSREERREAFFRCWTRKEAVLKALGWGLAVPLDSFEVTVAREDSSRVTAMRAGAAPPEGWRLASPEPAPGFAAAVAWIGPQLAASSWAWEGEL